MGLSSASQSESQYLLGVCGLAALDEGRDEPLRLQQASHLHPALHSLPRTLAHQHWRELVVQRRKTLEATVLLLMEWEWSVGVAMVPRTPLPHPVNHELLSPSLSEYGGHQRTCSVGHSGR